MDTGNPRRRGGPAAHVAGTLTRADVDETDLVRLLTGGEELTALTTALADLHPEHP